MAGQTRHLLERKGRFFARLAVPKALRSVLGKRELLAAIGGGRREALQALPFAVARMRLQIESARAEAQAGKPNRHSPAKGRILSPREMAQAHYGDQIAFDEELRDTDDRYATHGFVDENYVERLRQCINGAASNEEMQTTIALAIRKYQASGNTDAEFGTAKWRAMARALAVAEFESLSRAVERDEGDFQGKPTHPLLAEAPKSTVASDRLASRALSPESSLSLRELLPLYLKERGAKARSDYDSEVTVRMLEEFFEEKRPVYRIIRSDRD